MNPSPMQERLTGLLRDHFEVDPGALRPEASLQDLGMDSLGLVELLVILEEEDGIELLEQPAGLTAETTLAEAVRILEEHAAIGKRQGEGAVVQEPLSPSVVSPPVVSPSAGGGAGAGAGTGSAAEGVLS
ncbi:acyl carrier protein [Streptomyces ficellus]|uniref:Acyl carrier protein n=1 Tax=Streptomyces ficellus TaxID=1977088 RepID=A0A6I6FEH2_9ACTN|nr:acyl carrier protein [Streptomyces ficellus]QGV76869.1 acyl carrier protein [Streptomyces ficellus]